MKKITLMELQKQSKELGMKGVLHLRKADLIIAIDQKLAEIQKESEEEYNKKAEAEEIAAATKEYTPEEKDQKFEEVVLMSVNNYFAGMVYPYFPDSEFEKTLTNSEKSYLNKRIADEIEEAYLEEEDMENQVNEIEGEFSAEATGQMEYEDRIQSMDELKINDILENKNDKGCPNTGLVMKFISKFSYILDLVKDIDNGKNCLFLYDTDGKEVASVKDLNMKELSIDNLEEIKEIIQKFNNPFDDSSKSISIEIIVEEERNRLEAEMEEELKRERIRLEAEMEKELQEERIKLESEMNLKLYSYKKAAMEKQKELLIESVAMFETIEDPEEDSKEELVPMFDDTPAAASGEVSEDIVEDEIQITDQELKDEIEFIQNDLKESMEKKLEERKKQLEKDIEEKIKAKKEEIQEKINETIYAKIVKLEKEA